jgi:hypothetical protein
MLMQFVCGNPCWSMRMRMGRCCRIVDIAPFSLVCPDPNGHHASYAGRQHSGEDFPPTHTFPPSDRSHDSLPLSLREDQPSHMPNESDMLYHRLDMRTLPF